MDNSTETRIKGQANQVKGNIKKGVGRLTGDKELEAEGSGDIIKGHGQGALANAREAAEDGARRVSEGAEKVAGKIERATNKLRH